MNQQQNNPYAKAAGAYGDNAQKNTPDQRELEARVLLKSAKLIKDMQDNWADVTQELLQETLQYNRQIWMMFYDTALENEEGNRPGDLRSNIINLANFIFKREMEILGDKDRNAEKLDVLININKEIAAGLMGNPGNQATAEAEATPEVQTADAE